MLFRPNEEITVDQIVARVPKDRKQTKLEAEAAELSQEWTRLHDAQRAAIAKNLGQLNRAGHQGAAAEREIRAIAAKLEATQSEQRRVGQELQPFREAHGARLGAAMRPRQKELAEQALSALESLGEIWQELEELTLLVEREGGSIGRCPPLGLYLIERELERLAGK